MSDEEEKVCKTCGVDLTAEDDHDHDHKDDE
jgi:hypothetical protein